MTQNKKLATQIIGNIGLYYVCYELSKRGWNVLPTSRNAKGVDIMIYNQDATETHTIQVKALSKRDPVPLGNNLANIIAEFTIICRKVIELNPEIFILTHEEIKNALHPSGKENVSYWLETKDYEKFKDAWNKIGESS